MFETDIRMEVFRGVLLHERDGTPYWKLALVCSKEECGRVLDGPECLCFKDEAKMIKCRDEHGLYCSAECWAACTDDEKVAKEIAEAKKWYRELDQDERRFVDRTTDLALVWDYWQYIADEGCYDGSEFYEEFDIEDECPI